MSKQKAVKAEKPKTEWQIDSDIPIPPRAAGKRASKYPWGELDAPKKGPDGELKYDSFSFQSDDPLKVAKQFSSTCYSAGRRLGKKFTVRAIKDEDGAYTGEVRVWRKS